MPFWRKLVHPSDSPVSSLPERGLAPLRLATDQGGIILHLGPTHPCGILCVYPFEHSSLQFPNFIKYPLFYLSQFVLKHEQIKLKP